MSRLRWIFVAVAGALVVLVLAWFLWPDQATPLTSFWRRDSTWQSMQERGTWRIGLDPSFPPFEMLDSSNLPVGYDVDLARALAQEWGLQVEVVAIGFDSLVDALKAAKIDAVVSAYPYDPRLTRDVAFSQSYFDAGLQLAVRSGAPIQGVEDLRGKRVAVEWGSEGDMIGRQLQRDGVDLELVPFETPADAVAALVQGDQVDALLVDAVTLRTAQAKGAALVAAGPYLSSNPYVVVLPHRASKLLEHVNTGLETLRANGTLQSLESNWFNR